MVPYLRINSNQPFNGIYPINLSQLDHDFFFHLGEKVANGMPVTNEANLIKDFIIAYPKEKELILSQWDNLKKLLLGECTQKTIEFILPKEYVRWLRFSDYKPIYDNYYSGVETIAVMIDVKDLYEDVINGTTGLFRAICKKIQEESISSLIIDDCIDIDASMFIQRLKKKYTSVKYFSYCEWKSIQEAKERERQRKIQEQQEEEERLRKIAEKERIAKTEAECLANEEAERLAKDEDDKDSANQYDDDDRSEDETLIFNWLAEVYGRYDALGIISEEKRAVLQRAATKALKGLEDYSSGHIEVIPIAYATIYNGEIPKRIKHIEVRLTTEKLWELKHQTWICQKNESVATLKYGLSIHKHENKFGIVNDSGEIILPHKFDEILEMPSGYLQLKTNQKYGILRIDRINIVYFIVPCMYDQLIDYKTYEYKRKSYGYKYKEKASYAWGRMDSIWYCLDKHGYKVDYKSLGITPYSLNDIMVELNPEQQTTLK